MSSTIATDSPTENEFSSLSKIQKLAAFLVILKAESAAQIMSQLDDAELEAVSAEITKISSLSQEFQAEVLQEFSPVAVDAATSLNGGVGLAKILLEKSVGSSRASDILCRVTPARAQVAAMQQVAGIEPRQLFNLLRNEQLQTVALVASYMAPERASQLLSLLRPELQDEVIERLATLAPTSIEVVESVAEMLQKKFANNRARPLNQTGGVKAAAQVLNAFPRKTSDTILMSLRERNAALYDAVDKNMFTFADLERLDPKTLQKIMQEVDMRTLSIALKAASEKLKSVFFSCLSKRAADTVREEISFLGTLKPNQVEAAQGEIIETVKRLEGAGEVNLDELRQNAA